MPTPVSVTSSRTSDGSAAASIVSEPPPGIACSAFSTMFDSARAVRVRSTSTGGSAAGTVVHDLDPSLETGPIRIDDFSDQLRQ